MFSSYISHYSNYFVHLSSSSLFSTSRIRYFLEKKELGPLTKEIHPSIYILISLFINANDLTFYKDNLPIIEKYIFNGRKIERQAYIKYAKQFLINRNLKQEIINFLTI